MFFLEIYKTLRSRFWVLILGLLAFVLVWIFMLESDENRMIYNPLLAENGFFWAKVSEIYGGLFLSFLVLPVIITLINLIIFQDKGAGLLRGFDVFGIPKTRYWVNKFIYVHSLTLLICFLVVSLPPVVYMLAGKRDIFQWSHLMTSLFVATKIWMTMWATTICVFIFCIVFPKLYQSLLAGFGLILWTFIFPFSPVIFVQQGAILFQDLSLDKVPMQWTMDHFKWEWWSVLMSAIIGVLFVTLVFLFRRKVLFRRMFFQLCMMITAWVLASCTTGEDSGGQVTDPIGNSADSQFLVWMDTVSVMDQQGKSYILKSILGKSRDALIYLGFWNSHCIPCMKAFPVIDELSERYSRDELQVVFLNTDEDPDRWARALDFTRTRGHPDHYRVRYPEHFTMKTIGLNVYPRYVVLDQEMEVIDFRAPVPNVTYVDSLLRE